MDLEVAVVGGGVSGAYSAWRLQEAQGTTDRIGLFEYSNRIGGRLFTITMPGLPHVKAEVGGMRYIKDTHPVVTSLVEHLGLATKPFPMGAPAPVGANCNLFYLRGKRLRLHELGDADKVPYNMGWPERGLGPTQLQVQIMNNLYPNFGNLSLCEQMNVQVFGQPMYKFGFWNLLYRVLSNEGYQFMKDAGGYEANVANANAVTQLPATEYGDNTEFLTLRDGYDQLPITLVQSFRDLPGKLPAGDRVFINRRLVSIELGEGEFPYTLRFEPTKTEAFVTRSIASEEGAADDLVVRAKKVVLAMPRRSLELVQSEFFKDKWLSENLSSVLIQSAFKLFLAYERPWWRALGLVAGRSVTDLPVRQIYYFGTEAEQEQGKPWLNSLLMASYNDIGTVPFWKGLEVGKPYAGYPPSCVGENPHAIDTGELPASDQMVRIAHKQVEEVHGLPEIPLPYAAVFYSWNEDPYGGGWHEWKAGYRLDEIMCRMRKPMPEHDIHIVGEAYSYGQGWVEGALDTAESTLQEFFGLKQPTWLHMGDNTLMPNPCPGCGSIDDEHPMCIPVKDVAAGLKSITPNCLQKEPIQ